MRPAGRGRRLTWSQAADGSRTRARSAPASTRAATPPSPGASASAPGSTAASTSLPNCGSSGSFTSASAGRWGLRSETWRCQREPYRRGSAHYGVEPIMTQKGILAAVLIFLIPGLAAARQRPAPAVELTGGYAGFVDDAMIDHTMFGGAARFYLSPRISVGPEVQYMIGPGDDRDLLVTGNLTVDFLSPVSSGKPRTTPYAVVGGGRFQNTLRVGTGLYTSSEGAFTSGIGVRAWLNERVYLAPEFRVGWELHYRISGTIGIAFD